MKARVKVAFFTDRLHKRGEIVEVNKLSYLVEAVEESAAETMDEITEPANEVEEKTEVVEEVKKPRKKTTRKRKAKDGTN